MTRPPRPSTPAAHFDRPADVAAHIATLPAVVVSGPESERSALYAIAIARAAAATRRVALGDLVGDSAPIYALAGGEDAAGIADAFRDGLPLTEIARPVPDAPGLFVLPAGARVRTDPAMESAERWTRLVGGFHEAGGLLILVAPDQSRLLPVLATAGMSLLYAGPADTAPREIPLTATIGAALPPPPRARRAGGVAPWQVGVAAAGTIALAGGGAVAWVRAANTEAGVVVVAPARRAALAAPESADAAPPVVAVELIERTGPDDARRAATFAVQLVAADDASDANSLLAEAAREATLPAPTVSVVTRRSGAAGQRAARWHKVVVGAWTDRREADAWLATLRDRGVVRRAEGEVILAPFGVLLADSASPERARAVVEVWRAKGVAPYALAQDDGSMRVYAGAFESVAQAATFAAMVQAAGGVPIVAYRTGRPD